MLLARSTHGLDPQVKRTLFMPSATQSVPLSERTPEDVQKKIILLLKKNRASYVSPRFHNDRDWLSGCSRETANCFTFILHYLRALLAWAFCPKPA